MEGIASSLADVITQGENLRESLADIFKGIANDMLTSGIQEALQSVFKYGTGGGNALAGLIGTSLPSFDGGGFTGMGARSGGIDGKGGFPAILHPNEVVVDRRKGQSVSGASINLTLDFRGTTGDKELDARFANAGRAILAQVPAAMRDAEKRRG